jgi:hypothetical protein
MGGCRGLEGRREGGEGMVWERGRARRQELLYRGAIILEIGVAGALVLGLHQQRHEQGIKGIAL